MDRFLESEPPPPPHLFTKNDYTLRLDDYSKERVESFIKSHTQAYVIGEEKSKEGKLHCHAVFKAYDKVATMREDIKAWFEIGNGKQQNRCYSLSKIRITPRKAISYVLKDKNTLVGNINKKQLEVSRLMAYGKGRVSFKQRLEQLDEDLMAKRVTKREYHDKFIDMKIEHNQKPIQRHIKNHCILMFCKQDERYRQMFKDDSWNNFMPDDN
jgi:hypothetical protein